MTLAHLHVLGCPCSRCRVARNYARLRATVAAGDEADTPDLVATKQGVLLTEPERSDVHTVTHG